MFEITTTTENGVLHVALAGELNTMTSPKIWNAIEPLLKDVRQVVFDMTHVTFLASAGLRVMMQTLKTLGTEDSVLVTGASDDIQDTLRLTGIYRYLVLA